MRVIVAGSRGIDSYDLTVRAIEQSGFVITELVSGDASAGADRHGPVWADQNGVLVTRFPAKWEKQGRAAGKIRNSKMAKYAAEVQGGLVALWDGKSAGTRDMIAKARYRGLKVYVYTLYSGVNIDPKKYLSEEYL